MSKPNEGSIRKRANGMGEARYTDGVDEHGKQILRSVYGKTKKEAADKLHTIFYQKQQGIYVAPTCVLHKGSCLRSSRSLGLLSHVHNCSLIQNFRTLLFCCMQTYPL